ncbi:TolC family protein [Acinetobacter sp. A3.8]|uniref:TolC family protein n=1 Tax=Acinetobacter sedimenti TaxID=2919922 RepID=A0A9X1WXC0_9GAMM|nr:TolC family protein [Acinetobacter sedimenti]MCJ8145632.1 TolC family protein [Acinetobacter sedimenti]
MAMAVICASNTYADNTEIPSDSTKNQSIQASISNQNEQTHSLSQAIDQTLQYQLQTGLWQTQQQIGQANLAQSQLWQNPSLSIEQTGFANDQERELSIGIAQPLDIFGVRQARQNLAKLSNAQIELHEKIYRAKLELIVSYLWSQVVIGELEHQLTEQQLATSRQILDATQKRYQAGAIAQVDVDRIKMSVLADERQAQQVAQQLQTAKQNLSALWGERSLGQNMMNASALSVENIFPKWSEDQVLAQSKNNWLTQNLQLQSKQSYAELAMLKSAARPQPTLLLGMTQDKSPEQESNTRLNVGVEIPLNLFNSNQYKSAMVQAKQTSLAQQQRYQLEQAELKLQSLLDQLDGLSTQFQQIDQVQVPLAEQVQQKVMLGFRAGKLSVTDVQQATQQLQQTRLQKIDVLGQAWQSYIELQSISQGFALEEITQADALHNMNQAFWQAIQNNELIGAGE